jgi:putative tRNA adenosine deaminase-associated protein
VPAPTHAEAYAVLASREQGRWQVEVLPEVVTGDLDALVAAVRQQPQERDAVALVDVADEFFVAVRVQGGHVRLLLSDVTASAEWDLATQVVDDLDVDVPSDDALQHVVPAGDLRIFDDLGVDEHELAALLSDTEAYADELLGALAHRLGFANAYERVVDALVR